MGKIEDLQEKLREEQANATRKAEALDLLSAAGDIFPVGTILTFEKRFGSSASYTYTSLKSNDGQWYTSGPRNPGPFSWEQILQFATSGLQGEIAMVSETVPLFDVVRGVVERTGDANPA